MKTTQPCFECQTPTTGEHHVVPVILGGTKTVPLCEVCHGKVHGVDLVNMNKLARIGLAKKREELALIGKKLGNNNLTDEHRKKGRAVSAANKKRRTKNEMSEATALLLDIKSKGMTFEAIAEEFNQRGIRTLRGCKFFGNTISRLFKQAS